MKKIFLCGNTGSINRGCEAIVDSTVNLLNCRNGDIYLATFAPEQDRALTSRLGINMISYDGYPTRIHRYFYAGTRKIFKRSLAGLSLIQKPLFDMMSTEDISLNVGGDTYCYSRPINSLALNKYTHKKGITNILWCCSIEKGAINKEILRDLNTYTYIFAREQITVDNLISSGIDANKIVKVCDPAFFLSATETDLPLNFIEENTVGLNLSEMVINPQNPYVYGAVIDTIRYIIDKTDMNVCLIPHVYSIANNTNDYPILKRVYEEFGSERVSIVDRELNCEQLKYIISKCRFFVGARTHSTIAAYSSGVPTLVLGYSVKSKGIATDLFGTYNGFVLPYTEITDKNEILSSLISIFDKEEEIKGIYDTVLPAYKKQLIDAIAQYITFEQDDSGICDKEICSGCSACMAACPKDAITMERNENGFLYPRIDPDKCIHCNICRRICPTANKFAGKGEKPSAYAVVNRDEGVRLSSSSGGVFTLLAERVIENGGVVFGAGFDSDMSVVHKKCTDKSQLQEIRGSKYSQSEIGNTYHEAKECLNNGIQVLFTGTPCQIGGLYAFLGKDYDNLFTQDIICNSVPSPEVWKEFLLSQSDNRQIETVFFRDKTFGWNQYSMRIEYSDKTNKVIPANQNAFMNGFINGLYTRPSCSMCSFRNGQRRADVTLGDFWGIQNFDIQFNDNKGVTLMIVHSDKGMALLNDINDKIHLEGADFEEAIKHNPAYYRSPKRSKLKKYFFKRFKRVPLDKLVNKYSGRGMAAKIRRLIIYSRN